MALCVIVKMWYIYEIMYVCVFIYIYDFLSCYALKNVNIFLFLEYLSAVDMWKIFLPQTFRDVILTQEDMENYSLVSSIIIISLKTCEEAHSQTRAILTAEKQKESKRRKKRGILLKERTSFNFNFNFNLWC